MTSLRLDGFQYLSTKFSVVISANDRLWTMRI